MNVKTLIATDSPTTVTLSASNITTTGFLAACDIADADGATGTCTLKDFSGAVVDSWNIGVNRAVAGLTPGETYTLTLAGTANKVNPDGTEVAVAVNQSVSVEMLAPVVNNPPIAADDLYYYSVD